VKHPVYRSNQKSLSWFIVLLAVFLIVSDGVMLLKLRSTMVNEAEMNAEKEGHLVAQLLMEAMLKNDYAAVESFIARWGLEHQDIGGLRVTSPNGSVMADFQRESSDENYYTFERQLNYLDRHIFNFEMKKNIGSISERIQKYGLQLILISLIFIGGLGVLLWRTLRKTAIEPLQREIMEHRQTERALQKSAHDLKLRTQELESYSYSIAHDLRSPIRSVISFSQILKADATEKLDKNEREVLDRVVTAGKYMADLIDDILSLSRITRDEIRFESVDLGELAQRSIDRLREGEPGRKVVFTIAPGLQPRGDSKHLQILIENLFSNAWKYTLPREVAQIELGSRQDNHRTVFFVRDNGVGFDMQYVDKVFLPFQRLHGRDEFEGTGIGLAIVQRIVNRHSGEIWIESELDKGTTVFFTLGLASGWEDTDSSDPGFLLNAG
jgi:signal transduction histidine kinase